MLLKINPKDPMAQSKTPLGFNSSFQGRSTDLSRNNMVIQQNEYVTPNYRNAYGSKMHFIDETIQSSISQIQSELDNKYNDNSVPS